MWDLQTIIAMNEQAARDTPLARATASAERIPCPYKKACHTERTQHYIGCTLGAGRCELYIPGVNAPEQCARHQVHERYARHPRK